MILIRILILAYLFPLIFDLVSIYIVSYKIYTPEERTEWDWRTMRDRMTRGCFIPIYNLLLVVFYIVALAIIAWVELRDNVWYPLKIKIARIKARFRNRNKKVSEEEVDLS